MNASDDPGNLPTPDEETLRLWLDLDADGALSEPEGTRLAALLAERQDLVDEQRQLRAVHDALRSVRVDVRADFSDDVMRNLPSAAWETGRQRGWGMAAAAAAILAVISGLLLAAGGVSTAAPGMGVLVAVAEALQASAVTGAGLLGASWRGLGLALERALEASPATVALFAVGVVALNVLFFRLLRRRSGKRRLAAETNLGPSSDHDPQG